MRGILVNTSVAEAWARLRELGRTATNIEWAFALVTLVVGIGMILGGPAFAKLGIPLSLPSSAGGIPQQKIALFVFEMYLLFLALLCLGTTWQKRPIFPRWREDPLWYLTALLLVVGMVRVIPEFAENPVLAIRNSCFVWYLSVPLLLHRLPIRAIFLEGLMIVFSALLFLFLVADLAQKIPTYDFTVQWYSTSGSCLAAWALAFVHRQKRLYLPILFVFAVGISFNLLERISRTLLLSLVLVLAILLVNGIWQKRSVIQPVLVRGTFFLGLCWAFFLFFTGAWYSSLANNRPLQQRTTDIIYKALDRGAETSAGLEGFRYKMWIDAWELFLERPYVGIGFQRQVVYRIFKGDGHYGPNTGNDWLKQAPISGPHNGYLNALARLGIIGIGFFLLHAAAALLLWRHLLFGAFFIFAGQVIYAFFNVGLEGPARSFFILVILGCALKLRFAGQKVGAELWR